MGKRFRKIGCTNAFDTISRAGCTPIWIKLAAVVLFLTLQPAARASNLYSFTWNPASSTGFSPSTVTWTFSVPSILADGGSIPAASLVSTSITGVFASLGCKVSGAAILGPTQTGITPTSSNSGWETGTYLTGCSNQNANGGWTNAGYAVPLTTNGSFTNSNSASTLTIGPSVGGLAQVAFGSTLTTGIYVTNTGSAPATFSINFYTDNGVPLALPFTGGPVSTLSGTLSPQGSAYYEAGNDPQDPSTQGWAEITSDPSIAVQGLFRNLVNGTDYEAAIPATTGGSGDVLFPFDDTTFAPTGQPVVTGVAISNFDTAKTATITCVARDPNGGTIPNAVTIPALNPLGHFAGFQFPALNGLRGTVECTSNTSISATALRFVGNDLSSLPVIAK
jgi:hypothetical protein